MQKKCEQMSLFDTYMRVRASIKEDKPKRFRLLGKHIKIGRLLLIHQ